MSIAKIKGKNAFEHNEQISNNARSTKVKQKSKTTTTNATIQNKTQQQQATTNNGPVTVSMAATVANTDTAISTSSSPTTAAATTATTTPTTSTIQNDATTTTTSMMATTTAVSSQLTYLPQSSLLKIEPFVPSLNTRRLQRRPIGRSLSTLSTITTNTTTATATTNNISANIITTYAKRPSALNLLKTTTTQADTKTAELHVGSTLEQPTQRNTRAIINLRRLPLRGTIVRQRSKSTSSSSASANRPATATPTATSATTGTAAPTTQTGTLINGAIVTPQANGICRIVRLPAEQTKLPDRINYDRRGLTAIPIFENEPNLRLLSLQHNLINIFHIPKEEPQPPAPNEMPSAEEAGSQSSSTKRDSPQLNGRGKQLPASRLPQSPQLKLKPQTDCGMTSGSPALASPLTTQPMPLMGAPSPAQLQGKLFKRNSLQQKNFNFNTPHLPHKQQQPAVHGRLGIERAKSFISNYPKHLSQLRRNLHKNHPKMDKQLYSPLLAANLKSFDCGASYITSDSTLNTLVASELEEDEHLQQLQIKNEQLRASYGMIFQHLVFLDLYDNQIERIANLDGLSTLSVLLLGKNRISDITGLSSLQNTLRVLDLHGNKISSISNKINCLRLLKSLNLAGNLIRQINHNDFNGLVNLKELNLKRNKIKRINGFQHLTALERLWLCHNDLHKVDDMSSIAKATTLLELTIENNPVSLAGDCVSFLVSYLPQLQSLSQMPITDQVRQAAMAWRKHKELSESAHAQAHTSPDVFNNIRREEVISNARTNWELLRSQQSVHSALRKQRDGIKPSELTKINESVEAGVGFEELQEIIKLPPIENGGPTSKSEAIIKDEDVQSECRSRSSASSLGPNIDSSSSCFSSDNEESHKLDNAEDDKAHAAVARPTNNEDLVKDANSSVSSPSSGNDSTKTSQAQQKSERGSATNLNATTNNTPTHKQHQQQQQPQQLLSISTNSESKTRSTTPTQLPPAQRIPTTIVGHLPSTHNTPTTSCRRYMQGSLMRSHTIGNSQQVQGRHNAARRTNSPSQTKLTQNAMQKNVQTTTTTAINTASTSNNKNAAISTSNGTTAHGTSGAAGLVSNMATTSNNSTQLTVATNKPTATEREREQGGDYLIEICGRYLNIYGQGALRFIDKQWNPTKANDVHTLNFSYINFNNITAILPRIKVRFPHAEHFVFRETNISSLGQLNALAELQGITTLCIDPEGNPITTKHLWRQYAIYRLSHWGLKMLNGIEVSEAEIEQSNNTYAGLSDLVLWSMPEVMLQPLLTRLRLDETCTASKMSPKQWLMKADNKSLRIVVGKEALQWKKTTGSATGNAPNNANQQPYAGQLASLGGNRAMIVSTGVGAAGGNAMQSNALSTRERGKMHFALMLENTCNAIEKLHKLETLWPSLLFDMVRNTLLDYSQLDNYIRSVLNELLEQH